MRNACGDVWVRLANLVQYVYERVYSYYHSYKIPESSDKEGIDLQIQH